MALRAGFAEVAITPPLGTQIIGWLTVVVAKEVRDPLYARAAVFESEGQQIAFLQFDLLSLRWKQVQAIRARLSAAYGFPGENVLFAATHNHAGPAVVNCGDARRDDAYLADLEAKVITMFGVALANLQEAQIGFSSVAECGLSFNRRVVMRDGTVKTQATFADPDALTLEGPIDPELAVLAARSLSGELLGILVNFACHPTHYGSDGSLSAGFPGALTAEMQRRGCPITLFLNGAAGNLIFFDAYRNNAGRSVEEMGRLLAEDVGRTLDGMAYRETLRLGCRSETLSLPFRRLTEAEIRGTVRGVQRFVDPAIYDREIPGVIERIHALGSLPAQVQVLFLGEYAFVAIPAEYFVELGLRIKEETYPRRALIVGFANGMVGYVPHAAAFLRGGYETTFAGSSKMAPEAGDLLADSAIRLIQTDMTDQNPNPSPGETVRTPASDANAAFVAVAPLYDTLMYGVPYRDWVFYLGDLLTERHARPRHVLDLACGTGNVSELLCAEGYAVTGVDIAPGMISEAKRKATARGLPIDYHVQDAAELDLPGHRFDLCVSLFDSLNYIVAPERLAQAMTRVAAHLTRNGLFIFDLNTEYALRNKFFDQDNLGSRDRLRYDWDSDYFPQTRLCRVRMRFWYTEDDGQEHAFEETHWQYAYRTDEILTMLSAAGFDDIATYQAYTLRSPGRAADRIFYVARKAD
jgi:SAM-dependent methyltransferase